MADSPTPPLHLACSSGGHIDLLMRICLDFEDWDRVWVTQRSARAQVLHEADERVLVLPDYDRNIVRGRLVQNLRRSAAIVRGTKPKIVVTTGSGLIVPFCLIARLAGARIVFVETSARVSNPSRAGFILSRIAAETLVQWAPMLDIYPRASLCRPSVLDDVLRGRVSEGRGTFIGVGTHIYAFDRLLRAADRAVEDGLLPGPIVAQTGVSTYRPRTFSPRQWLDPEEMEQGVKSAQYVVSHGGSGIISVALSHGRRPLVFARSRALGEHFDDHQEQLLEQLSKLDLIAALDGDQIDASDIANADRPLADVRHAFPAPSVREATLEAIERASEAG